MFTSTKKFAFLNTFKVQVLFCGSNPEQRFRICSDFLWNPNAQVYLVYQVGFQHVDFTITSVTKNVPYKFGLWITQVAKGSFPSSNLTLHWLRLTASMGRQWWPLVAVPSFTLASRESSSRSTLKASSISTTKTTTAASGFCSLDILQNFRMFASGLSGAPATSSFRQTPTISCWNLSPRKEEEVNNPNSNFSSRKGRVDNYFFLLLGFQLCWEIISKFAGMFGVRNNNRRRPSAQVSQCGANEKITMMTILGIGTQ